MLEHAMRHSNCEPHQLPLDLLHAEEVATIGYCVGGVCVLSAHWRASPAHDTPASLGVLVACKPWRLLVPTTTTPDVNGGEVPKVGSTACGSTLRAALLSVLLSTLKRTLS